MLAEPALFVTDAELIQRVGVPEKIAYAVIESPPCASGVEISTNILRSGGVRQLAQARGDKRHMCRI